MQQYENQKISLAFDTRPKKKEKGKKERESGSQKCEEKKRAFFTLHKTGREQKKEKKEKRKWG